MERRGARSEAHSMETPSTRRGGIKAKTGIERIASRARSERTEPLTALMHHFSVDNLRACFESLDGTKALGVDGVSKQQYGQNLESNLQVLHCRVQQLSYRPQPVRQIEIPKEDGSSRPLGIACTEDKIVQEMARQILEAIYEPVFVDTSYGFRPNRSCHDALRQLNQEVMCQPVNWIADIDLAKFFDTMPHREILDILSLQIGDRRFLRLISRLLKSGIQTPGGVHYDELGSPQGSIVSPVIANVFLDHVLDKWFTEVVCEHCRGYCAILRYADDAIAVFENEDDARRFMRVLPRRLEKFGLHVNAKKTHLLACGKRHARRCSRRGKRPPTFDFLGLTHYWGHSRKGYVRLKRKTSKKRLRRSLREMKLWLKQVRSLRKLPEIWTVAGQKLRGHFNYFGVTDNGSSLCLFEREVHHLLFKWLNRRSQKRSLTWEGFGRYKARHPLPSPGRLVSLHA